MSHEAAGRIVACLAWAFLATVFVFFAARDRWRDPGPDEVEYLHTALRMDRGERVFVDFSQHHSPLFFAMLMPLAGDRGDLEAMQSYVERARLLMLVSAAIAITAAALIVWRASGRWYAPVAAAALILSADGQWGNGLGDVRAESPGLALWWGGAALVLLARRGGWRGLGLGLIFTANLVNPKWPVASLAVGLLFLADAFRDRRAIRDAAVTATLTAAAAVGALLLMTDLKLLEVHVVRMGFALRESLSGLADIEAKFPPFARGPQLLRPLVIVPAAALIALAWAKARNAFASPKLVVSLAVIAAAALLELRFFYTWPVLDYRWYAFWAIAGAALVALVPQSAEALLQPFPRVPRLVVRAVPLILAAGALAAAVQMIPPPYVRDYWRRAAWIEARLKPGETVWLDRTNHPLGLRDSSYYWFGFWDVIPSSLRLTRRSAEARRYFPSIGDEDLPPCRIERGLDRTTRFLEPPNIRTGVASACFDRLSKRGVIVKTPLQRIWMVQR